MLSSGSKSNGEGEEEASPLKKIKLEPETVPIAPANDEPPAGTNLTDATSPIIMEMDVDVKEVTTETNQDLIDKEAILAYLESEYKKERERCIDHILELFYLETQGNLMDYYSWRKKPPSSALLQYLKRYAPDDEDFEEYKKAKHSLDSSLPYTPGKFSTHLIAPPTPSVTTTTAVTMSTVTTGTQAEAGDTITTSSSSSSLLPQPQTSSTVLPSSQSSITTSSQTPSATHSSLLSPYHLPATSPIAVTTPTVNNTSGNKATVPTSSSLSSLITSSITPTIVQPSPPQPDVKSKSNVTSKVASVTAGFATHTPTHSLVSSKVISSSAKKASTTDQAHSISSVYEASIGSQEQIVERAKQEAYVMQRITDLRKEGLWTAKRLPKVQEPPRAKAHWDYLLEEMMWLATDFAQERKWKKAAAKKCAKMVVKYHQDKEMQAEKAQREEQARLRKIAGTLAKAIREFWGNVEKLVEFRQQTRLEEKRKRALDLHLKYIVDQTEKYSSWIAEGLTKGDSSGAPSDLQDGLSCSTESCLQDTDFDPNKSNGTDDEETIAKEEAEEASDQGLLSHEREIDLLKRESEIPLDELIQSLDRGDPGVPLGSPSSVQSGSRIGSSLQTDTVAKNEDDDEFMLEKEDDEDDEETIREQEMNEGDVNYDAELQQLQDEADMPIEQLWEKYGASTSALDDGTTTPADEDDISMADSQLTDLPENSMSLDQTEDSTTIDNCDEDDEDEDVSDGIDSDASETEEVGMRFLIDPKNESTEVSQVAGPSKDITDIAAGAERIQPKGNTLLTTKVATKVPFLLKHTLREYQHIGLDWLAAMYEKKLNGILADEMGLGKTIQTIALLAHLACDKGIWGPHLIVVPTSVMLNWEMEFKKWCPAFKILTYYGSPKERKLKRQGWTKPNQFHVCITSYKLVIQDHQSFRRKKWKYLILDEAQHIKNFKSQRWQMLLNFNTSRRLLLTGTPLQNNLMELWSLMHFLMPNVFASHRDFKDWFVNPVTGMIEGNHEYNEGLIRRLHKVLRPFLLRRLKQEVEKQLPKKYEHVILCRLSKRQRFLYEEFMNLTKTKETLASGNFLSVINVLMQLRKVCNHPNLFETRPIISPFAMEGLTYHTASLVTTPLDHDPLKQVSLDILHSSLIDYSYNLSALAHHRIKKFHATPKLIEEIDSAPDPPPRVPRGKIRLQIKTTSSTQSSKHVGVRTLPVQTVNTSSRAALPSTTSSVIATSTAPAITTTPLLQLPNSRYVLVPNSASIKTLTSTSSNIIASTSSETTVSTSTSTPTGGGNIVKKLTINTPLTHLGQPSQLGNQKVKIQIGKLVQTPSGQHILLKPVPTTPVSSATPSTKPVLIARPPTTNQLNSSTAVAPIVTPSTKVIAEPSVKPPVCTNHSPFLKPQIICKMKAERKEKLHFLGKLNSQRCAATPMYAPDLIDVATVRKNPREICTSTDYCGSVYNSGQGYFNCLHAGHRERKTKDYFCYTKSLRNLIKLPEERLEELKEVVKRFVFVVPPVSSPRIQLHASHIPPSKLQEMDNFRHNLHCLLALSSSMLHPVISNRTVQFPELRLIQYDCGKLQTLDNLLWRLKSGGHRVLIFTQMSRMLDIFEQFLNYHGHTYLRLDGSTRIEQRQALMERFNADKRIFCFILSTRSGGIGVNLTGADTVIFYDSDWNPTMDAQAQDRCHRIGQTRDVHIYRLISEKTVEENILKKAQQKRLLGDVAIEGGNFTTAFFKENSIKELFDVDVTVDRKEESSVLSLLDSVDSQLQTQIEHALENAEEAPDVAAAKTARAEAAAEYAEFDETIPIDNDTRDSEEKTAEEKEVDRMVEQLTPVERYAMQFLESIQEPTQAEQLKQAEEEIEAHKKEWELCRLKSLKEDEEALEKEDQLTMSIEDDYDQVYVSYNGMEQMSIWAPPTPPQDENDLYIDYSAGFLYETSVMPESQLPAVYLSKDAKRLKIDTSAAAVRHKQPKLKKEEVVNIPRSLFDKPSPALLKLRKELKSQKLRGLISGGPDPQQIQKLLNALGTNLVLPTPLTIAQQVANSKSPQILQGLQQDNQASWGIHEDWAVLNTIQFLQEIPLNLLVLSLGHIPNWDLVSDIVNSVACFYRSPKICRHHYESVILMREEGKLLFDPSNKKLKKQQKSAQASVNATGTPTPSGGTSAASTTKTQPRPMRTSHIYAQDSNLSFSQMCNSRFETIKQIANKRTPTLKPFFVNSTGKNSKHIALLQENGINYEQPLTPMQVAQNRAERIAKEKAKNQQQQLAAAEQLRLKQQQQQQQPQQQIVQQTLMPTPVSVAPQPHQTPTQQLVQIKQPGHIKTVLSSTTGLQPGQQHLQQSIQAKVATLSQNATAIGKSTAGFISAQAMAQQQSEMQHVANIAKDLSQAAASFTVSAAQQTSAALNPVTTVLPEGTRLTNITSTAVAIPTGGQEIATVATSQPMSTQLTQSTGTVISVSPLPQQPQQKVYAVAFPTANQMTAQLSAKLTPTQLQNYKQIFRHQARPLSQASGSYTVSTTQQTSSALNPVNTIIPEGRRIANITSVPIGTNTSVAITTAVQEISIASASQAVSTQLTQPTGTVISVSPLPQQQQQKVIALAISPTTGAKLTPAQFQQYKQTLMRAQARQTQNIQISQSPQQVQLQQITQQTHQPGHIKTVLSSASGLQPAQQQFQQSLQAKVATFSHNAASLGKSNTTFITSLNPGLTAAFQQQAAQQQSEFQQVNFAKALSQAAGSYTVTTTQQTAGLSQVATVLPEGRRITNSSVGVSTAIQEISTASSSQPVSSPGTVISVSQLPQQPQPKVFTVALAPSNQVTAGITKLTTVPLQTFRQQLLRQPARQLQGLQAQQIQIQQNSPQIQLQQISQQSQSQQSQQQSQSQQPQTQQQPQVPQNVRKW